MTAFLPRSAAEAAPFPAAAEREFRFSDHDFVILAGLVKARTGISLSENKRELVYARLSRRLRALGLESFKAYRRLLAEPEGEREIALMINAITTNLTSFFREGHHFDFLARNILTPLAETPPPDRRLRIWSAGCSSGEEPYSIAMTMRQAMPRLQGWNARILATDIDSDMVARAAAGVYPEDRIKGIPETVRRRFLEVRGGAAAMTEEIRSLITFKQLNLLEEWPMSGPFDVIFCRNVVIYFDRETQLRLFDRFADILKPGGWLFIGHSENLYRVSDRFSLVGRTIYQRVS